MGIRRFIVVVAQKQGADMSKRICEYCGAKIVQYKHGLSKSLMRVLYRIIKDCNGEVGIFEFKNIKLSYNEGSNFQKLRYWGLIEKVGDDEGKGGTWMLTQTGLSFACGELSLQKFAKTYRGELVCHEGEDVKIEDITGGWKWRIDYAREAEPL